MKRSLKRIGLVLLLPAVLLVLWRWYLVNFVNRHLTEIHVAGLPVSGTELNQWSAPVPDAENAALVLTQAFALHRDYTDSRSNWTATFKLPRPAGPLADSQVSLLAGYVAMNAATLTRVEEASQRPASRFPADWSRLMNTALPHLARLDELVDLQQYAAVLAIQAGDRTPATNHIGKLLALARTLDNESCLMSQLVRRRFVQKATETLERRVNAAELSAAEIATLGDAFSATHMTNLAVRALIGERALTIPYYRMTKAGAAQLRPSTPNADSSRDSILPRNLPMVFKFLGQNDLDFGSYLVAMNHLITLAGRPPPENLELSRYLTATNQIPMRRQRQFSGVTLATYWGVDARQNDGIARQHLALTSLAVEQFRNQTGHLPASLEELPAAVSAESRMDPFTGQPLKYRLQDKGYLLYSIGPDGKDNDGLEFADKKSSADKKSYDITFIVAR